MTRLIRNATEPKTYNSMSEKWNKALENPRFFERSELLELLEYRDSNGIYTDDNCVAHGFEPFTHRDAFRHMVIFEENENDIENGIDY